VLADGYDGEVAGQIARLARFVPAGDVEPAVAAVAVPGGKVEVVATDGLDLEAAGRKREQRRAELAAEIERAAGKLANAGFVDRAPEHVVAAEREKLARYEAELEAL
jgi:valyl-tRNA synthetase